MFTRTLEEEFVKFRSDFDEAMKSFNLGVLLDIIRASKTMVCTQMLLPSRNLTPSKEHEQKSKGLLPCMHVHFQHDSEHVRLDGTRSRLRASIMEWLRQSKSLLETSDSDARVLHWLFELAGSGKSTIANTIAAAIEDEGFCLTCFFCKRNVPELSNPKKLLITTSYRIPQQHGSYCDTLYRMLADGSPSAGVVTAGIDE